ncbi:MAG: HlyD family type I secretion periplasmic adaptor subunit [Desulfofustis sp.]|nr:HlyD family type I secretion periplasmic adaptor subunit [Desulfofustis sp.]NNK13328.1 HlyD family type I secretion periplasmic adaptor subunit [Desulfofustis sp.]RZW22018.1 MAG: HlyD family type I secretion periplasmic adaptor subunit [Desulfobulbaceae bacterium]
MKVSNKAKQRNFRQKDLDLVTDIRTTILVESPRGGRSLIWLTLILLVCAIYWASISEVEEVTRGMGKVVPSSQIQIIQNLEGGILAETYVNIGDIVEDGQLLMRLDEKRFSAPYQEYRLKYLALTAKAARLTAETEGIEMALPKEVEEENTSIAARERQLYNSRKAELVTTIEILEEKAKQRRQDLAELEEKLTEITRTYQLLKREIELTEPLVGEGAVSEVELLRLQREASSMLGDIAGTKLAIPRVRSQLQESLKEIKEEHLQFSNNAKKELNEVQAELDAISATSVALADRLERTSIRSPVYGTVKQVLVNTVGGVIQPGMDLIEIVPLEDTLLVEAQIKPSDIAFLRPEQEAMVKFTAYDFTIYGGLDAQLEYISADSVIDEKGNAYYQVRVRTNQNYLMGKEGKMPIIPGMVATVDILTGKKTILSYLLKPILKAKHTALRER